MPLTSLTNAGFRYPGSDRWIFRHFDMTVEPGEAVHIVGRNGSGKSTLLKTLSGILEPTEGNLYKQLGTTIAYMDQFSGEMLARDLTIAEQFKAAAASNTLSRIVPVEMLSRFGLGLQSRLGEFIGHLSGGQRQIIALLCILAAGADILCLDEFTSALDDRSRQVADSLLIHAKTKANIALVLVSHSGTAAIIDRELAISVQEEDNVY